MTVRVNGGIITDQMLRGNLRYFKMTASTPTSNGDNAFKYTISNGAVIIPGQTVSGRDTTPGPVLDISYEKKVGVDRPVPDSVAERALRKILENCIIEQINIVSMTEIHFSASVTENWESNNDPLSVASNMQAAVRSLAKQGNIVSGPLVVGETYTILSYKAGDNFSNIGGPAAATDGAHNSQIFVASGTSPTVYTNGTILISHTGGPSVPDLTVNGSSYDFSSINIVEVPFELA